MNPPKIRYDRPQVWFQETNGIESTLSGITGMSAKERLRVFIPRKDGKCASDWTSRGKWRDCEIVFQECCYHKEGMTMRQLVKAMHEYDKERGWPKAYFVGNL